MSLDDALSKLRDEVHAKNEQKAALQAIDADRFAEIKQQIGRLAYETSEWLSKNQRPKTGLASVTLESFGGRREYRIVLETRGWMLDRFFLDDNGDLYAYKPAPWFSVSEPAGWKSRLSEETFELGVHELRPFKSESDWRGGQMDCLHRLRPVLRPTSTEYTDHAEVYLHQDRATAADNFTPLTDRIAEALLSFK